MNARGQTFIPVQQAMTKDSAIINGDLTKLPQGEEDGLKERGPASTHNHSLRFGLTMSSNRLRAKCVRACVCVSVCTKFLCVATMAS